MERQASVVPLFPSFFTKLFKLFFGHWDDAASAIDKNEFVEVVVCFHNSYDLDG